MCEVCAIFGAGEHWSDFGRQRNERFPFDDIQHYRAERKRRILLLNELIAHLDLSVTDWDGETLAVHNGSGRFRLAPSLSDVWEQIETLADTTMDPLAESFTGGAPNG